MTEIILKLMIFSHALHAIFCFQTQNFCLKQLNKNQQSKELKHNNLLYLHHHSLKFFAPHKFDCADYCTFNKEDCSALKIYLAIISYN